MRPTCSGQAGRCLKLYIPLLSSTSATMFLHWGAILRSELCPVHVACVNVRNFRVVFLDLLVRAWTDFDVPSATLHQEKTSRPDKFPRSTPAALRVRKEITLFAKTLGQCPTLARMSWTSAFAWIGRDETGQFFGIVPARKEKTNQMNLVQPGPGDDERAASFFFCQLQPLHLLLKIIGNPIFWFSDWQLW